MKKGGKRTGWNDERRARQAENIKQTKPWLKTTGPKTIEGKDAVKKNALKHGAYSEEIHVLRQLLRAQAEYINRL